MPDRALLDVRHLEVAYGPATAVRNVKLAVAEGEIVALLGANGAGKTTTLRGISGLVRPRAGQVRFAGRRIDGRSTAEIVRAGLAHVPEGRRLTPGLTVLDNLLLGAWGRKPAQLDRVFEYFPRLAERRTQLAGSLSGGEQQMAAIGRALMSDPRLLMIDELSLGLSPVAVDELLARLVQLNREGLSILLIEQFVHRALAVADRVAVLVKGRVVFDGTAEEARRTRAVESAYLLEERVS
jgi:branched-chain amino acid transport system ATP-binding protein